MAFMVRYLDVVSDEMHRMRIALALPWLHRPRPAALAGPGQGPSGALFIRSYERGERVHLAMLSRGHTGRAAA